MLGMKREQTETRLGFRSLVETRSAMYRLDDPGQATSLGASAPISTVGRGKTLTAKPA